MKKALIILGDITLFFFGLAVAAIITVVVLIGSAEIMGVL